MVDIKFITLYLCSHEVMVDVKFYFSIFTYLMVDKTLYHIPHG